MYGTPFLCLSNLKLWWVSASSSGFRVDSVVLLALVPLERESASSHSSETCFSLASVTMHWPHLFGFLGSLLMELCRERLDSHLLSCPMPCILRCCRPRLLFDCHCALSVGLDALTRCKYGSGENGQLSWLATTGGNASYASGALAVFLRTRPTFFPTSSSD